MNSAVGPKPNEPPQRTAGRASGILRDAVELCNGPGCCLGEYWIVTLLKRFYPFNRGRALLIG